MYNMIYPAILGSILYTVFQLAADRSFQFSNPMPWFAGALFIALFTLDYTYSLARDISTSYSRVAFALDLVVVVLMFVAATAILGKNLLPISVWLELVFLKLVVVVWEVVELRRSQRPLKHVLSDFGLLLTYILFTVVFHFSPSSVEWVFMSIIFIADGLFYIANTSEG
jgi:hypothetical protein